MGYKTSRDYDRHYAKIAHHFVDATPSWLPRLRVLSGKPRRILVVGAGDGSHTQALTKAFPNVPVFSLDLSIHRCRRCRRLGGSQVLQGDGMAIPVRPGSFDLIVCPMVIEHVASDAQLLAQITMTLQTGGMAMISSVVRKWGAVYFHRNDMGRMALDPTHVREYPSREDYVRLLSRYLTVLDVVSFRPRFSALHFVLRALGRLRLINVRPEMLVGHSLWQKLAEIRIPIPRYLEIEAVVTKSE